MGWAGLEVGVGKVLGAEVREAGGPEVRGPCRRAATTNWRVVFGLRDALPELDVLLEGVLGEPAFVRVLGQRALRPREGPDRSRKHSAQYQERLHPYCPKESQLGGSQNPKECVDGE